MIGATPERVHRNIDSICALSQFNEHIRIHVLDEHDLSGPATAAGAENYVLARGHIADAVQWKVFSHCASITRLYALYEAFVYELVAEWLSRVPALFRSYAELPETLVTNHRVGIGVLLQKLGGGARTEGLTELGIVEPLYLGLGGNASFSLVPEAFFIDLRNLRHEELCQLFRKVSLGDLASWLAGHSDLQRICDAAGTTCGARLKDLVERRNEASHAREEIQETLGVSAFLEIADFVRVLCTALHQFVCARYVDVLQDKGRLEFLGKITEYLPRAKATILRTEDAVTVSVKDEVILRGPGTCYAANIAEIQDHDQGIETAKVPKGHELGVKFIQVVDKVGLQVFRVRPSDDGESEVHAPAQGGDK